MTIREVNKGKRKADEVEKVSHRQKSPEAQKAKKGTILLNLVLKILFSIFLISSTMSYLLTESPFWGYEGYYTNWRNFVPTKDILLTPAQLSKFDGSDPNLPIYLSIDGNIYDVTLGRQWYGKGGSYNVFAGRDSSRAFATNCLSDESHFTYDLRDLTPEELKNLNGWKRFYGNHHTYHKVGKLVGFTLDKDSKIPEKCKTKAMPKPKPKPKS